MQDLSPEKVWNFEETLADKYGVYLDLSLKEGDLSIDFIEVPDSKRGQGIGSEVMEDIISFADGYNIGVRAKPMTVSKKGEGKKDFERLVSFYKSFGFQSIEGSKYLRRPPKENKNKNENERLPIVRRFIREEVCKILRDLL